MDAAYFRKLFAYNRWANDRVLEQAMALPVEDYTAKVPGLSFETLHATLTHVFVADAVWLGRWKARPLTGDLADARRMDRVVETEVPTLRILLERWRAMESDRQEYLAYYQTRTSGVPSPTSPKTARPICTRSASRWRTLSTMARSSARKPRWRSPPLAPRPETWI